MNKKGFTLVELMVVIVIIGVLAAVAIPRMMAAADRARAAEGPQMLGAISRMQHAFRAEHLTFITATDNGTWAAPDFSAAPPVTLATGSWVDLGFDATPTSRFYAFTTTAAMAGTPPVPTFTARATVNGTTLGASVVGGILEINQADARTATGGATAGALQRLVPNWQ